MRRFGPQARVLPAAGRADSLAQYGFRLTESSKAAGLTFVHEAPTLDPQPGYCCVVFTPSDQEPGMPVPGD